MLTKGCRYTYLSEECSQVLGMQEQKLQALSKSNVRRLNKHKLFVKISKQKKLVFIEIFWLMFIKETLLLLYILLSILILNVIMS